MRELELRKLAASNQRLVRISYKGYCKEEALRCDVLVEECVLVEAKSVERISPIHKAQLLNVPLGLLINFNATRLVDGVSRLILPGADA